MKFAQNIPNCLTVFRILLIPFFVWQMIAGNTLAASIILGVSAITDIFDGALARRLGWVTKFGKIMDPVADKVTLFAVCVVLLFLMRRFWIFFVILIAKDILGLVLGSIVLKRKLEFSGARWYGKVSTVAFYITMIILVLWPGIYLWLAVLLLVVSTGLSLIATFLYIQVFRRLIAGEVA